MIGKMCRAPSGGGSAYGLVEYLVGYAVAEKGANKAEIRDALEAVFVEAEARQDLGVGRIWSPVAGGGTRPSSIVVRNCASFSTASLEMDADALVNPGVRNGAMHFVWSFQTGESSKLTDEQVHAYVGEVLAKIDLGHYRSVAVVHRDTLVFERNADGTVVLDAAGNPVVRDGNIHVHLAVGSVDPVSGLAYDRTGLYRKMAWAEREVELGHGLEHDRGLAVIQDRGLPTAHPRWADKHELAAWNAARKEERLLRLERRSWEGYRERDRTFARYCDATIAPRLRAAIDMAVERGRKLTWADFHSMAARYGASIEREREGRIVFRDVGIGEMRYRHGQEVINLRRALREAKTEPDEIARRIAELKAEHVETEAEERERKMNGGETVSLESVLELGQDFPPFLTVTESEHDVVVRVEQDPRLVLRDVTAQSSTFSREDVDLWLCSRISDPEEIERLGGLVMRDESIRVLNVDTPQALCTTLEILAVEDRLASDAHALAHTGSGITREQIEREIATYEAEQAETLGKPFHLTGEQRTALLQIADGSLLSIEGLPGSGKTTVMGVVRVLGEQTGREVVGITLSQAAAERLQSEAGFLAINSSRAALLEEGGTMIIPERGIVVVDEAAMMDSRAMQRIVRTARERHCIVQAIYDTRQLQPIDFGASSRIVRDAAKAAGTHCELRDIQRQKRDWHRRAVEIMADAIVERDDEKRRSLVRSALKILDANAAIVWCKDRDEAIDEAVRLSRVSRSMGNTDVLTIAADKDTVRHLAEEDRRRAGREGKGLEFLSAGGTREIALGDEIVFLENSLGKRGLGVLNGDRGVVTDVARDKIAVRVYGSDNTIMFSPRAYKAWDYGSCLSVHKAQGATTADCVAVLDRAASAELTFVAMSRSKSGLSLVVAQSNFASLDELADHIAGRISLKTTTHNYEEIVERTGGRQTMRVINMEAQREAANSPLRKIYDAHVREPALAVRAERLAELRTTYDARKREIAANPSLTIAQRLDAEKAALSEFRSAAAETYKATQPQSYLAWLDQREASHERARGIVQRHEMIRESEQGLDREHAQDKRAHETTKEIGYEHER